MQISIVRNRVLDLSLQKHLQNLLWMPVYIYNFVILNSLNKFNPNSNPPVLEQYHAGPIYKMEIQKVKNIEHH